MLFIIIKIFLLMNCIVDDIIFDNIVDYFCFTLFELGSMPLHRASESFCFCLVNVELLI